MKYWKKKKKKRITEYLLAKVLTPGGGLLSSCFENRFTFSSDGDLVTIYSKIPVGFFRLLPYARDNTVYFYDFSIEESLRGRGLATAAFPYICEYLRFCGYRRVILHVSGDNKAALSLYRKAGFTVIETVTHYR